ncbi:IS3 family transposase [Francisella sp. TX07-6608]|uniref:IS3 family transposase n=1 Tax=Francisella sp. TX07-6608 TaxID=573568 RepID=UPI0008F9DDA2|nr:IS3 family transposase [Francisella sp. TX07-6608]OIN85123.1 transposase family protein [Francisella sp. TX07-6608]
MSKKRVTYTADFKAKVIIELLEGDKTVNEIASKYDLLPKNVHNWKQQFLSNACLAFDKSSVVKEYKQEIDELKKEKDATSKKLGEVIVERDFLMGKLKSLVSSNDRVKSIDTKLDLSLNNQLKLLSVSKTLYYYTPIARFSSAANIKLLNTIDLIHTKHPYYGTGRLVKLLNRLGFLVGRKLIKSAMEFMGIKALYPKKKTTTINKQHNKYPYLLNAFKNGLNQVVIDKANKVWSADITYIRLENGYAYLAAIIDWYSKKILAWKLSNTMDTLLTTSVLNEALLKYEKPDIFNSDQGVQYTAKEHIKILSDRNIQISMDAKGRSIDNIVIERFWRTLKYENVYPSSYRTMNEAKLGIKEYIEIYNNERMHSSIGYMMPDEAYSGILKVA